MKNILIVRSVQKKQLDAKQIYLAMDAKFEIFGFPVSYFYHVLKFCVLLERIEKSQRCNGKVESVSQCNRILEQTNSVHGLVLIIALMSSGGSDDDNYFDRV
ncbi:conserved hypothetical protein [Trichinella spiralis]|uniref:hypothetical protein n=1 Tax=Trichinella spiralis TaxID=6334 RepID=UPI0001EFBEF0|nr:conserved hypothetical protein [Trichinella spiralis]